MLNKSKGQMYPWVNITKNPIRGRCPHACTYCYVPHSRAKHLYKGKPYLVESFFEKGLGKGKTIFIGSCFDIWANEIYTNHPYWVGSILRYCKKYPDNTYLFQTKNPWLLFWYALPANSIVGTTAETNRPTSQISKAPNPRARLNGLSEIKSETKMISIEPIMDFDLDKFICAIEYVAPKFVSIGADSKGHGLPEPPAGKVKELIQELEKFTEVKVKPNLSRLLKTP